MACFAIVCGYMMRVCISIVMTQVVLPVNKTTNSTDEVCPLPTEVRKEPAVSIAFIFLSLYLCRVYSIVDSIEFTDFYRIKEPLTGMNRCKP